MSNYVFRIVYERDWARAVREGSVSRSPLDIQDGFVHLSSFDTVIDTANLYFDPSLNPLVLKMSVSSLGEELRWEWVESRQAMFPHLYGVISVQCVHSTIELIHTDIGFELGQEQRITVL